MDHWQKVLITPQTPILKAIEIIDQGAIGAAIVVDEAQQLQGIVTDGDIRRGILNKIPLDSPVNNIMNPSPKYAYYGEEKSAILNTMKKFSLHQLPIVNEAFHVVYIELMDDFVKKVRYTNTVVLMAGGYGTRLRPLTNDCPKPLLKIDKKPMLEIIFDQFISYGFENFILSLNYRGDMIKNYFGDGHQLGINIDYLEEDRPLGTAGALSLMKDTLHEPFIVMNGDIMTQMNFKHLLEFHHQHKAWATLCVREYQHTIPYGVVSIDNHQLISLEEKPQQQFYINAGIYVLDPCVLQFIPPRQSMDMPELLDQLISKKLPTAVFPIREYWLDIGRPDDFHQAHKDYRELFQC
jgi:dTDP-glucose pyrophosphorylase